MAEWEKVDMVDFFPSEVKDVAEDVAEVADEVATVLNTTASFIDGLADFVIDYGDPIGELVDAVIQEVIDFVGDMRKAGMYALPVVPKDRNYKRGIDGFYDDVNRSLRDGGDPNIPTFSASSDMVAYVFLYGATDLRQLWTGFLDQAKLLFDFGEFKDWEWADDPSYVPPRTLRAENSRPPDWKAGRVADVFPPYDDLLRELEKGVSSLKRGKSSRDFVEEVAVTIRQKAVQLEYLADFVEFFADQVEALFNMDDLWYLKIGPMNGGPEAVLAEIYGAGNKPPYYGEEFYIAGIVLVAGGPDVPVLEGLLG